MKIKKVGGTRKRAAACTTGGKKCLKEERSIRKQQL